MRRTVLTMLLLAFALVSPGSSEASPARDRSRSDAPRQEPTKAQRTRQPATADELSRYAEREKRAKKLEEFEGGRRGGGAVPATTIIIILLVVILVVVIV